MTAGPDATVQDFNARPLTSANWADLEALFSLRGGSIVRGCWCMHYRRTGAAAQAPSQSKAEMRDLVSSGVVPGLVGYLDGTPAGWISLGPRPDYLRLRRSPVMKPVDDTEVWCARRNMKEDHMFDVRSITVDCADPYRQALFWSKATGWQEDPDDPNNPGDPEGRIVSPQGFSLLFIPVPEGKRRLRSAACGTRGYLPSAMTPMPSVLSVRKYKMALSRQRCRLASIRPASAIRARPSPPEVAAAANDRCSDAAFW